MTLLPGDTLLLPREVAARFGVEPQSVGRWARKGLISHVNTPGGARRYWASEIEELVRSQQEVPQ
jgi:predicted site-specific integrase-resolvase